MGDMYIYIYQHKGSENLADIETPSGEITRWWNFLYEWRY